MSPVGHSLCEGKYRGADMSSYSTVQLSVTTRGTLRDNNTLDLSNMLGPGGCTLLRRTIAELGNRQGPLQHVAEGFPWQQVDERGERFTLHVRDGLPQGIEGLQVH